MDEPLTRQEQRLRLWLGAVAALSVGFLAVYLLGGVAGESQFPFVVNSVAKDGLFIALCLFAMSDVRQRGWMTWLVIFAHVVLILGLVTMGIAMLAGHERSIDRTLTGPLPVPPSGLVWGAWLASDVVIVVGLWRAWDAAQRARFGLRYLSGLQYGTLAALAEVLVPGAHEVSPADIAKRADEYLAGFRAHRKYLIKLAFIALAVWPLLTLRPPFALMSRPTRLAFLKRRFVDGVGERTVSLRAVRQSFIRAAQQMAYFGYYSDEVAARTVGYLPFSKRPGAQEKLATVEENRPRARARPPRDVDSDSLSADVVVVGSGAAGAVIAHRLVERGRRVLMLERGLHVDPGDFTESEGEMLSLLYADGALQLSRDFRFQVLQAMCVGGGTTVNNGVCFDLPAPVLKRWNDPDGLDAGLPPDELASAFKSLRALLPVTRQPPDILGPGGFRFERGVHGLGLDQPPNGFGIVEANIDGCLGSGYCNIGCRWGRKLSMLETLLPWAQARGPDALEILSECRVTKIEHSGARATGVRAKLSDGREIRIRADTVVVSAGAIASSLLLRDSGIGGPLVGRRLAFNIATPMHADFPEPVHAERGLQISHTLDPSGHDGIVMETWFNPVVTQSLVMPGWFEEHRDNMRRYAYMATAGVAVGSESVGRVRRPGFLAGAVDFRPTPSDMSRVIEGLKMVGRILLAAGATRVMPPTYLLHEFRAPAELEELDRYVREPGDISLNSAHPQGGNALSCDPAKGVVNPSFRVHGFENLHVCDASVFPSAITVNPQLTVMALAWLAADRIDGS